MMSKMSAAMMLRPRNRRKQRIPPLEIPTSVTRAPIALEVVARRIAVGLTVPTHQDDGDAHEDPHPRATSQLGATSRADAIARAEALSLLDPTESPG
jgi:hypothetical protein